MKQLLCVFMGHDWQPLSPAEIKDCIRFRIVILAKCGRCGHMK